ncbi:MAG: dihydroorotate dehydrogenase electron transfer subunit [Bacillota bacterium]
MPLEFPLAPVMATVLENRPVAPGHFRLRILAPGCAQAARPGQFVHLRVSRGLSPLLRRPISIARSHPEAGELVLLVRHAGAGTQWLGALEAGDQLDLVGPLGQGFSVPPAGRRLLVAAGGIGIAPLVGATACAIQAGAMVTACVGARSAGLLVGVDELEGLGARVRLATDDGSAGHPGLVTALVREELSREEYTSLYACGPVPMLAVVQDLAREYSISTYISLEQYMACGVGACLGCAVQAAGSGGYLKVCRDGPVFCSNQVVLAGLPGGGG